MKKLIILMLISTSVFSSQDKSICGSGDTRASSSELPIGRAIDKFDYDKLNVCTITMISPTCGISAGHCKSALRLIEFNVPASIDGEIQHSKPEDIYEVDQSFFKFRARGEGADWSVFKVLPNQATGKLAGDTQGYLEIQKYAPRPGSMLKITGYGFDKSEPTKNLTQQQGIGKLTEILGAWNILAYQVDTMGGTSGSAIISADTGKIVGIHTHGGCDAKDGENVGTILPGNRQVMSEIKRCLESK